MTLNDLIDVTDDGIEIKQPKARNTDIELNIEDVPDRLSPHIDFFHGRPALHLYTYNQEEPEYSLLLPTNNDPHLRTLKRGDWENDELYEKLRSDEKLR